VDNHLNLNHRVGLLDIFILLVGLRNNRILHGITSLSAPAQTATTRFPSVKTIGSSTPPDYPFAKFPNLTRPSEFQRTFRHNTILHPRTPPENSPRRADPLTCSFTGSPHPPHNRSRRADWLTCSLAEPLRNKQLLRKYSLACIYTGPLCIFFIHSIQVHGPIAQRI
jgi:hypothetical protein